MGQLPPLTCLSCNNFEVLSRPKITVACAHVTAPPPGPQGVEDYNARYQWVAQLSTPERSHSSVIEVRQEQTRLIYICRRMLKSEAPVQDSRHIARHLTTLCELEHPHMCKLVECFEDEDHYYLICERAEKPYLLDFVETMGLPNGEIDAAEIVRQMASALAYCHVRGIVHGRINPNALLLAAADGGGRRGKSRRSSGRKSKEGTSETGDKDEPVAGCPQVKIAGMGLAFVLRQPIAAGADPIELVQYIPPERAWAHAAQSEAESARSSEVPLLAVTDISGNASADNTNCHADNMISGPGNQPVSDLFNDAEFCGGAAPPAADKLDIWSLGIITYYLIAGFMPYRFRDEQDLLEQIRMRKPQYPEDAWMAVGSKAYNCCRSMLKLNQRLRPTASDLLKDPWLMLKRERLPKARLLRLFKNAVINLSHGQFKKLVNRVIVEQMAKSHPHIRETIIALNSLDRDRDGLLSLQEWTTAFDQFPEIQQYLGDVQLMFDAADRDGSGGLNHHEFAAATLPPELSRDERNLWYAFRAFDRDEDGFITIPEVSETIRILEGSLSSPGQHDELIHCVSMELHDLGFIDESFDATPYQTEQTLAQEFKDRWQHLNPAGPRRLDYGEFVFITTTKPNSEKCSPWCRKETFRCMDVVCDIDMYNQFHKTQGLSWPPKEGAPAKTPRSIYRHTGGLAGPEDSRKKSRKRKTERFSGRRSTAGRLSGQYHFTGRTSDFEGNRSETDLDSSRLEICDASSYSQSPSPTRESSLAGDDSPQRRQSQQSSTS